jgi:hypothetical protein
MPSKIALRDRAIAVLPCVVLTVLTALLYYDAYSYWTAVRHVQAAWENGDQRYVGVFCLFASATTLAMYIPNMPLLPFWFRSEMLYPVISGALAVWIKKARLAWAWHIIACLTLPAICGRHCLESRFYYAPIAFSSIYTAIVAVQTMSLLRQLVIPRPAAGVAV